MKTFTNQKLGLDIGTKSLGWSITGKNEANEWEIVDFGVRLWDSPENPKSLDSAMMERRNFRSQRRMQRRKQARIKDLKQLLEQKNLIKITEIESHFENLKQANDFNVNNPKYEKQINPIYLRAQGLTEKLTPLQIAIVLINYAKRRGYNNVFETNDKRSGISKANEYVKKYDHPVQAILKDEFFRDNKNRLYYRNNVHNTKDKKEPIIEQKEHILFLRDDYKKELEQILKTQSNFYDVIDDVLINQIVNDIVFRQRDFEDGPGPKNNKQTWKENMKDDNKFHYYPNFLEMVGKDQFFKDQVRTHNYSILGDIFSILNTVNQILILDEIEKTNQQSFIGKLSLTLIENYLKNPIFNEKIVSDAIISIDNYQKEFINLKKATWNDKFFINSLFKIDKQFVNKNLGSINLNDLNTLIENPINKLGTILYENKTPSRLIRFVKQIDSDFFQEEEFIRKHFLMFNKYLSSKVFSVSSQYIFELLQEAIKNNNTVNKYNFSLQQQEFINLQQNSNFKSSDFLKTIKDVDMIRNKVVFKALNQVRKVTKQILKTYGDMDEIVIEVAKDLYSEVSVRKNIRNRQDNNEKFNQVIEKMINDQGQPVNASNKERVKLFLQQKRKAVDAFAIDPYSLYKEHPEEIRLENIFSNDYEVDHILPYSMVHDDSLNNKVLVKRDYNQRKRARSVIDWLVAEKHDKKVIDAYKTQVKSIFKKNNERKWKNLIEQNISRSTIFENETNKINDTRYITSYITKYLKEEFLKLEVTNGNKAPTIITINGGMTSQFRRRWLNGSAWGDDRKVRNITPFHHAVDAMILTNISNKLFIFQLNTILRLQRYFYFLKRKREKGYWDDEYIQLQIERFQKSLHYNLTIINRYLKNNEMDELNYDEDARQELRKHLDEVIEYVFAKFWNYEKIDWKNDSLINKYSKPRINDLITKLETLIPVKLIINKDKENDPIEISNIEYPIEWAKNTNRLESEYPFISNKIERKISGSFGDQNPVKKNKVLTSDNQKKYYKGENSENYFQKKKYLGFVYDAETKDFTKYSIYDAVQDFKFKNIKNNLIISKNVAFQTEDKHIYLFKSFAGRDKDMKFIASEINLSYSNEDNYQLLRNDFIKPARKSKKIFNNAKIIHINSLGKLKGTQIIK